MMNERAKKVLLSIPYYIVLTMTFSLAVCTPPLLIERLLWESEVSATSYALGIDYARRAFDRGERKVLELRGTQDSIDTGEMDGECHIWTWFDIPSDATWPERLLGTPHRVSSKAYVKGWNAAMRKRVVEERQHEVENGHESNEK